MSINKIDYDVLEQAKTVYENQAAAIDDVITTLVNMNSALADGWTNQTSAAFINRFETDHKAALQTVRDSVQGISEYIAQYSSNRQDEDAQGASAISG